MALLEALKKAGVDTEGSVARFVGNVQMYEKFLNKFPADDTFLKIKPAFDAGNWEEALNTTHTLKGLSGNLGMTRLYNACSSTVVLLRAKQNGEAKASYGEIESAYNEILSVIQADKA